MDGHRTQKHRVGGVEVSWTRGRRPKGLARPQALTIAPSLGGKAFDQERKPQCVANIYSSEGVEVGGKRWCWSKGKTRLNGPLG